MMASLPLEEWGRLLSFEDPQPQPSRNGSEIADNLKNPPTTDGTICHILSLPVELLMQISECLAPDNVQPHMDSVSFHAYKKAQNDLRSLCLASKQMAAVARPQLYRAVTVNNVDVLAYLLRTFDETPTLGQHVKRLVLEVQFNSEDDDYRKPNVAVLESRPNYSQICEMAVEAMDVARYQQHLAVAQEVRLQHNMNTPLPTFMKWKSKQELQILGLMHFEILLRTSKLESLCFGMICSASPHSVFPYSFLFFKIDSATGGRLGRQPVPSFMSNLRELQVHGTAAGSQEPYSASFLSFLLGISSLRVLKCLHDDGNWFDLDRYRSPAFFKLPSRRQYKTITYIDLQRSRRTPPGISQICNEFPYLEYLCITVDRGASAWTSHPGGGSQESLSTGLAKLERLRELTLNLHYQHDVKKFLGPNGVLNLSGLKELVKVRLPLHFLVERQPEHDPFIPDLGRLLPPSAQHLTVWADVDSVDCWGFTTLYKALSATGPPTAFRPYHPGRLALGFLDSVSTRATDHFRALKEVRYCYRDNALDTSCHCREFDPCDRCEDMRLLNPWRDHDSRPLAQDLASRLKGLGIRLSVVEED